VFLAKRSAKVVDILEMTSRRGLFLSPMSDTPVGVELFKVVSHPSDEGSTQASINYAMIVTH